MARSDPPRFLFYFLHLLGVGHVYRAKRLIEGFARYGIAVDIIYGGEPISETFDAQSIFYLPPIRAEDATYKITLDDNGTPITTDYMEARKNLLLDHFATLTPDMILTEAFPFGRRVVRHELIALIEAAKSRTKPPLIVSSVRDILQERKKPGRTEETLGLLQSSFDHVLVHSDPDIIRIDETFSPASAIADIFSYTGFVVPDDQVTGEIHTYDVIVSAGGGGFGVPLLTTAIEASFHFPQLSWCLTTGPHMSMSDIQILRQNLPSNVEVVNHLDNLSAHMQKAKISISQCGYNTAMDVLRAHNNSDCRAVFVPYDTQGQSEQLRRAELLANAGFAINLPQSQLSPDKLITAINQARLLPNVEHHVDMAGVENSARIVREWLDDHLDNHLNDYGAK